MSASLRSLSDSVILFRTLELTRRERSVTLQVLVHLQEVERRALHLTQGHASMFVYCTRELGYSESAANLRIRTARCLARFPEVYDLLASNEINPSTLSQVAKILTPENKTDVLCRIRKKSQREVEAIVAAYEPRASLPGDRVRTVVVRVPVEVLNSPVELATVPGPDAANEWQENHRCNSGEPGLRSSTTATEPPRTAPTTRMALLETRKVFKFTASEAFEKKFERIKSLASHRLPPNPSFEQVFELAMDCFLEREDPVARQARRVKRAPETTTPEQTGAGPAGGTRYVPARIRDGVFARDQGQCTDMGPSGQRCGSRHVLQIDHIQPIARGGASATDNLRLLCAYHHRLEAERLMGRGLTGLAQRPQ